jgi:hypothetical protein
VGASTEVKNQALTNYLEALLTNYEASNLGVFYDIR